MTRPPLHVYITGPRHSADATLRALADAHGQRPHHDTATLLADKHAVHLHRDVHRGHAIACAVLVVLDHPGVDRDVRLAALHARREGVHRFVLFIHQTTLDHADRVEREARAFLMTLGVDGDAVPVVRSTLREHEPAHLQADMRALLAAIDDLPPFLAPAPLRVTPPTLTREGALLDAVHPLYAPATRLEQLPSSLAETAALRDGAGGSHLFGAPYLDRDVPWPRCARCDLAMGCALQLDSRDVPHGPAAHGLFVVFLCPTCHARDIHHHTTTSPGRRRPGPPDATIDSHNGPELLRPVHPLWQLPTSDVFTDEHPDVAARLRDLIGGDPEVEYRGLSTLISGDSRTWPHYGGHPDSEYEFPNTTPRCPICAAHRLHVAQVRAYGDSYSLWACREHPTSAVLCRHEAVHHYNGPRGRPQPWL